MVFVVPYVLEMWQTRESLSWLWLAQLVRVSTRWAKDPGFDSRVSYSFCLPCKNLVLWEWLHEFRVDWRTRDLLGFFRFPVLKTSFWGGLYRTKVSARLAQLVSSDCMVSGIVHFCAKTNQFYSIFFFWGRAPIPPTPQLPRCCDTMLKKEDNNRGTKTNSRMK